ncbi:MAG: hypothetical protein HQK61_12280 [Desulfamplus sp.]|nr:hypothetical protein [Desulfamplus sp.]
MKQAQQDIPKTGLLKIWIIWGAMLFSLLVYVVICYLIEPTWGTLVTPDFPVDTLRNGLYATSLIILFLSDYIRKYIMKSESSTQLTRFNQIASRTSMPPALLKYQTAVIISLALSESIAIFGVVFFFLAKDLGTLYIFVFTSAAAMLYHRPKMSELMTNHS